MSIEKINQKYHEAIQDMLEQELVNINEDTLCEMASLSPDETNLPCLVWADGPRNMKHGLRIKFQDSLCSRDDGSPMIPITISDNPQIPNSVKAKLTLSSKDLEKVKRWVVLNKDVLTQYAKGTLSTKQLLDRILPLGDDNEN